MARKRRLKPQPPSFSKILAATFLSKKRTRTSAKQKALQKQWELQIKESVAREIWAVLALSFSALLTLSISNQMGLIGELINKFLTPIFGWGIYILPALLFIASIILFFSKTVQITMAKLTGAGFFIISLLSIFHLSVPEELILDYAIQGTYGGYIGFITNWFFRIVLKVGNLGSSIIFVPTFLISLLLTFEISLKEIISSFIRNKNKQTSSKNLKKKQDGTPIPIEPNFNNDNDDNDETLSVPNFSDLDQIKIIKPDIPKSQRIEIVDTDAETEEQAPPPQPTLAFEDNQNQVTLEDPFSDWNFPTLDLLDNESSKVYSDDKLLKKNAEKIREKLKQFDIQVSMSEVHVGPTVIQYTLKPAEGVKLSKITNLKNDLALALAAKSIRIEAPIPGKALVGIELPAEQRMTVRLREMLESQEYNTLSENHKLIFPLGRDVTGKPIMTDLSDMPHLLIAGATGAGKSVAINTFLISLLFQNSPSDLKFIMVDPKQVELKDYNGIPHLLSPVITDPEKAANALKWAVAEMNRRYQTMSHHGCRNIEEYNQQTLDKKMPKIIILIDELADLMMSNGKEVETSICRLAQMARAVGIHLVIATQRPSVDVITGLIKANIPTRISFAVTSSIDSRTILDTIGAEELLGKGDMLYLQKDFVKPMRIQGILTSTLEIKKITNYLKLTFEPDYKDEITESPSNKSKHGQSHDDSDEDDLYSEAYTIVVNHQKASASLLQRKLKIGYARAARLLDLLEDKGVVGPVNGAKPREIFINH